MLSRIAKHHVPEFGWGIPSGFPTKLWDPGQSCRAVRLGQSIFVDLGSIAPDGSWNFDLRLTLRVRGCRTALRLCVVFKMQIPPEHSAMSHPPRYGATCGNGILAYRAYEKVVARPTCSVLVSYTPALLTFRADRERIIRLRRLVQASLQHNANVNE